MPLIHRKKHGHEEDGDASKEKEQHEQEERKSVLSTLDPSSDFQLTMRMGRGRIRGSPSFRQTGIGEVEE